MSKINTIPEAPEQTLTAEIFGETVTIKVKTHLTLQQLGAMVSDITSNCFSNGLYAPYTKHLAIAANTLAYYTDLELPEELDDVYRLCGQSGIVSLVTSVAGFDRVQYDAMLQSVEELIAFGVNQLLHQPSASDEAIEKVAAMADKGSELIQTVIDLITKYDKKLGKLIKPKQIQSMIENLSKMDISEGAIVNALIEAMPGLKPDTAEDMIAGA